MMLPSRYTIDYEALCRDAAAAGVEELIAHLRKQLPIQWRQAYSVTITHTANIVTIRRGTFEYFYDWYSGLEAQGEVPFDQRMHDRVIGALGTSAPARRPRRGSGRNGWSELPEELSTYNRDNGHFMAHCIGGGLDVNVFSQSRDLNRGFSEKGKLYRQMEKCCCANPGTFCFSRPIYADTMSVPQWLEFGLIKEDGSLWVEVFEN